MSQLTSADPSTFPADGVFVILHEARHGGWMLNRITPAQAAHNMEDKDFCDRVLWVPAGAQYVYNDCAAESDSTTIGTAKTTPPAVPSSTWGRFQVPDTYYDISLEQMQPWSDEP